jgi:hypothetical protein
MTRLQNRAVATHRPSRRDFCNKIGHDRTHALHNEFEDLLGASLTEWYPEVQSSTLP